MKNIKYNLPLVVAGVIFFLIFKQFGMSSVWINLFVVIAGMFVSRALFVIYKTRDASK